MLALGNRSLMPCPTERGIPWMACGLFSTTECELTIQTVNDKLLTRTDPAKGRQNSSLLKINLLKNIRCVEFLRTQNYHKYYSWILCEQGLNWKPNQVNKLQ